MAWIIANRRPRSVRSVRGRKNTEDDVNMDLSRATNENVHEILVNVCKKQGLSEGKRFGYLNAFVKLLPNIDIGSGVLGYTIEEIQCCLRVALIHDATLVRAAALRTVRYLLKEERDVRTLLRLQYPYLIARSLDVSLRTDTERVQALRLIRRMLLLCPADFPTTIVRSLISVANGGADEKDRLLRSCLAVLLELCVLNPNIFIACDGVGAVTRNILEAQMPKIAECLCGVLLFLLDNPSTREQANVRLQILAAPYCDWSSDRNKEQEIRFQSCRTALLTILRTWPGLLHFCDPNNSSGLKAIINILYLKQLEVRKAVLDLLYDLLGLPQPEWTDEFSVALEAVDPSRPRDNWKLSDGFVAAEGKSILPHLSKYRPNIVEIHLSVLLFTFLETGLLHALIEVIVSSDTFISLRATILLGELLQLIHFLLPPECCDITPALPNLIFHASNAHDLMSQHHALVAVTTLSHLHHMLKRRPAPASLFLDHVLQSGTWSRQGTDEGKPSKVKQEKLKVHQMLQFDDALKDSGVLTQKDGFSWNWNLVRVALKSHNDSFKKLEDSNCRTFLKRLVYYFKPSSNQFSRVELCTKKQTQMYTLAGCELIDCLLDAEEGEGSKLLSDLLKDISANIDAVITSKSAHDCFFSPQQMMNSLCQDYFLFIGRLCRTSKGMRALDKTGIFQQLLNLVASTVHDCYVKLVISSLDYSVEGMPRTILGKVLTASCDAARLYATQFLLVLLRAHLPNFHKWGIDFLVNQLFDQSKAVSLCAVSILSEATEEKVYLDAVIASRPSLMHLGDKGLLLLIKLFSTQTGFTYFQDANYVSTQLEKWSTKYNYRYVRIVEGELHDSLTLHQRGEDGRYSQRVTSAKHQVHDVYVPPHLYGQLVQHEKGFQLLVKEGKLNHLFQVIHSQRCTSQQDILELKAALWGCGHIGTSPAGVAFLSEEGFFSAVVNLAESCPVYSIRGTAFYVLGLLATTVQGVNELRKLDWFSVRHHRHDRWPVIDDSELESAENNQDFSIGDDISLSSDIFRRWSSSSQASSQSDSNFYIPDCEVGSEKNIDDGGLLTDKNATSNNWKDFSDATLATPTRRKSQTLPHSRPMYNITAHRHFRSLSESKQSEASPMMYVDWKRDSSKFMERGSDISVPHSFTIGTSRSIDENKSRSNSCTDSSGISSYDSAPGKHGFSEHIQTLTPIPSSTSLTTLRSTMQASKRKISLQSNTSDKLTVSPEISSRFSPQDLSGFITLRVINKHRRPLFSDTSSLAAAQLIGFDDHYLGISSHACSSKSLSMERQYSHPILCEFEAPLPPQLLDKSNSASLGAKSYVGSRSAISSKVCGSGNTQQTYMGISLPQDLMRIFPQNSTVAATKQCERSRHLSTSEMEQVREAVEESDDSSSSSTEDTQSYTKSKSSNKYRHSSSSCLACCRLRERKISTSSYQRHRTDTESSYGGGESPVLLQKSQKLHGISSSLLGLTLGGSCDSGNSLDACSSQQEKDETLLSKALARKQILRHVGRLSNPVWYKSSRQALLQLKQKFPSAFQDVCLYSEVSHRLGLSSYGLCKRRFIQELFLDLSFDSLYDDATSVLQFQSFATDSASHSFPPSPHVTVQNFQASPSSGSSPSLTPFRGITSGLHHSQDSVHSSEGKAKGPSKDTVPKSDNMIMKPKSDNTFPRTSSLKTTASNGSQTIPLVKEDKRVPVNHSEFCPQSNSLRNVSQSSLDLQDIEAIPMIDSPLNDDHGRSSKKIEESCGAVSQVCAKSDFDAGLLKKECLSVQCNTAFEQKDKSTILVTRCESNSDKVPYCSKPKNESNFKLKPSSQRVCECNIESQERTLPQSSNLYSSPIVCSAESLVTDKTTSCKSSATETVCLSNEIPSLKVRTLTEHHCQNVSSGVPDIKCTARQQNSVIPEKQEITQISINDVSKLESNNLLLPNCISDSLVPNSTDSATSKRPNFTLSASSFRHRKIGTAFPPNISTLTKTKSEMVPSVLNAAGSDVPNQVEKS